MPIITILVTLRPSAGTMAPCGRVLVRKVAEPVAGNQQFATGSPRRSGCAPASGCRCGRRCRSACSRPGSRCTVCHGLPRECRRSRPRPAGRRRAAETASAICGCHRSRSAPRRSPGGQWCNGRQGPRAARARFVCMSAKIGNATNIEPVPDLVHAHLALLFGHACVRHGLNHLVTAHADQGRLSVLRLAGGGAGRACGRVWSDRSWLASVKGALVGEAPGCIRFLPASSPSASGSTGGILAEPAGDPDPDMREHAPDTAA